LHLKNASASDALVALVGQTGHPIASDPTDLWSHGSWPTVTIDVDKEPFWKVLGSLSTKLGVSYINDLQELQLTRGSPRAADRLSIDGAFIFGASAYTTRRSMIVEVIACGEPKSPIIRVVDLKIERGVDDQGNQLMSVSGRGAFGRRGGFAGGGFGGRWGSPAREGPRIVNLTFQHPQEGVLRIAELRGKITVSVQTGQRDWEIDDPLNAAPNTCTIDSIPVTFQSFRGSDDSYELRASIPFGWSDSRAPTDEIADLMRRSLTILDAQGHALAMGSPDATRGTSTTDISVDFTRSIGKSRRGMPAKLTWRIPETARVTAPFSFKELPIDGGF